MTKQYVIGIDYGTDSARALVLDTINGREISVGVSYYPRWKAQKFCKPDQSIFRQHPQDYIDALIDACQQALAGMSPEEIAKIGALGCDTTGSTPVAVNAEGTPLSLTPQFSQNPSAMFYLWKDHSSEEEAQKISSMCKSWRGQDFTQYCGGSYSSEWYWAKLFHMINNAPDVAAATYSWVEHCDWLTAMLVGDTNPDTLKRSRCAAGHKAMWHASWGGYPSADFLQNLNPKLAEVRLRLPSETYTADQSAGALCKEWADKLGLPGGIAVSVGTFDAHAGAVGSGVKPGSLLKIMGTSTCDLVVKSHGGDEKQIKGIAGQVDGSIIPGMIGYEAGQSAFGDIYAWYRNLLSWPLYHTSVANKLSDEEIEKAVDEIIAKLSEDIAKNDVHSRDIVSIDWFNGRRTPYVNMRVKGAITGLNLGSTAPMIFKSLVQATIFGTRRIAEEFAEQGVDTDTIIASGGVAKKSALVMQTMSDALNMPIKVVESEQACALGSAIYAAVAGGMAENVLKAQEVMASEIEKVYQPDTDHHEVLNKKYEYYKKMGGFTEQWALN